MTEILRLINTGFRMPFWGNNYPHCVKIVVDGFKEANVLRVDPDMRITISAMFFEVENEYRIATSLVQDLHNYMHVFSIREIELYVCLVEGGLTVSRLKRISWPLWGTEAGHNHAQYQCPVAPRRSHTAIFTTTCGTTNAVHERGYVQFERSLDTGNLCGIVWHPDQNETETTMQAVTVVVDGSG